MSEWTKVTQKYRPHNPWYELSIGDLTLHLYPDRKEQGHYGWSARWGIAQESPLILRGIIAESVEDAQRQTLHAFRDLMIAGLAAADSMVRDE